MNIYLPLLQQTIPEYILLISVRQDTAAVIDNLFQFSVTDKGLVTIKSDSLAIYSYKFRNNK